MVGIAEQGGAAITDFMSMLVIMVDPVRQDALAAENLLHRIMAPFRKDGAGTSPCPICESLSPFLLFRAHD